MIRSELYLVLSTYHIKIKIKWEKKVKHKKKELVIVPGFEFWPSDS